MISNLMKYPTLHSLHKQGEKLVFVTHTTHVTTINIFVTNALRDTIYVIRRNCLFDLPDFGYNYL